MLPLFAGAPFWGHVVSRDLVRWAWLPPALLPDQTYDRGGVWSGSATIINEGDTQGLLHTAAELLTIIWRLATGC
jgi:sucrose-6-phosphate hydrolase SacC (GH32 family)